jgi:hypothetical protein
MSTDILSEKKAQVNKGIAGYYIFMALAILCLYAVNNLSYHQFKPIDPSVNSYYAGWIVEVANKLAAMQIPYASTNIISCLWAINLFLAFCIVGNFILLLYRPRWFHHLIMLAIFALAIFAVYIIYQVFPFDFNGEGQKTLARIILWVIVAALAVGMVLRLFQLIQALNEREPRSLQPDLAISAVTAGSPPGIMIDTVQTEQAETPQLSPDDSLSPLSPDIPAETAQTEQPGPDQPSAPQPPPETSGLPPAQNKPSE